MRNPEVALLSVLLSCSLILPPAGLCAKTEDSYLIGRDDVLDITVWQSPDLTKAVAVQSDGAIDYPLLGNLPAAGLTPADLAKTIQQKLSQGFVKNPQVNISIKEYNSKKILVFGEVDKPGLYKLKGEIPVLELLFMVGGAKTDAKRLTIIRSTRVSEDETPSGLRTVSRDQIEKGGDEEEAKGAETFSQTVEVDLIALLAKGDLSQNATIFPGDTIYVASGTGERYYVLGQVLKPGPYEWVQEITVLEAIKLAGGATERGALNRIKVRKELRGQKQEIKVNVLDIMKGKKKDDIVIHAGDTIIVPESWI